MNKQVKPNSKQDVIRLKELLKEDFKGNFQKFKKIYKNNSESKPFIKYFIKSDILVNHFTDLLSDHRTFKNKNKNKNKSLFEKIIDSYFSQDKQINLELIQQFKENDFNMLQATFFKKEAYKSIKHVNSLKEVFSKYDNFLCLVVFLNRISIEISSSEKEIISFLRKTKFDDLLNLVSYYLNVSSMEAINIGPVIYDQSPNLLNDPNTLDYILGSMAYPKIMDMVASLILNKKIKLDNKQYKLDRDNFLLKSWKFGMKPEKKKIELIQKVFKHFRSIMEMRDIVSNLMYGEFVYNFSNNDTLNILPRDKEDYLEFKKSEEKERFHELLVSSTLEDSFASINGWGDVDNLNKETEKSMASSLNSIVSLLDKDITIDGQNVEFREMVWVISKLAERSRRMFGDKISRNDVRGSIQKVCSENIKTGNSWLYINNRSEEELVTASLEELKEQLGIESTPEKIISIFNFFTTDINNMNNREINLVRKPFIKVGDQYIWSFSSLIYKNLYKIITMNIFSNPQQKNNYIKKKATNYEEKLCDMFKEAGFKAMSQVSEKEDMDVVAYKNGYLFIVEAKVTYSRLDYHKIKLHTEGALRKAERQLNKRKSNYLSYLNNNVMETLGIKDVSNIKVIVPLIITNSFEGKVVRENGIFKLNERELEMYLTKKSSEAFVKMAEADYYWKLIKEKELCLVPYEYKFKNLEVIHYA